MNWNEELWGTKESHGVIDEEKYEGWGVGDRFRLIEDAEDELGAYEGEEGVIVGITESKGGMFRAAGKYLLVLMDDQEDPGTITPYIIDEV